MAFQSRNLQFTFFEKKKQNKEKKSSIVKFEKRRKAEKMLVIFQFYADNDYVHYSLNKLV